MKKTAIQCLNKKYEKYMKNWHDLLTGDWNWTESTIIMEESKML